MAIVVFKERVALEGVMPHRALLRLKRAGITVYNVKKPQKNRLIFCVKKKDLEKVFAIYPKVCYNSAVYSPYTVTHLGAVGAGKIWETLTKRVGALVGALLFCGVGLAADTFVFGVEFVGSQAYRRETLAVLADHGLHTFAPYRAGKEDLICSKLLSLRGVEFCSVKKTGFWLRVEMRLGDIVAVTPLQGNMTATRSGKVLSIAVLSGTALKTAGDEVRAGDSLVGAWFTTPDEKGDEIRTPTEVVARVRLSCEYRAAVEAESAESAFAKAYLALELSDGDAVTQKRIEERDGLYEVFIAYEAVERWNM